MSLLDFSIPLWAVIVGYVGVKLLIFVYRVIDSAVNTVKYVSEDTKTVEWILPVKGRCSAISFDSQKTCKWYQPDVFMEKTCGFLDDGGNCHCKDFK